MTDDGEVADHGPRIKLRSMSSVKDDVPTLAWEPKSGYPGIAVGTVVIFGGRPAAGKSTGARWFVAEATNGTLPGAWRGTPVGAAWIGTEESEVYMMKPGLRAAGADLDKVVIPEVQFGHDGDTMSVLHHLNMDALAEEFRAKGIKVVVLDPLMSAVGSRTDVNRSNEVRARLEPWVKLAEAIDGVVIGIAHLKKSFTGDVVAALNGSSAFGEVARSIFGFAKDDNADDGTRLMSHAKSSIGPEDLSYTYTLEPVEVTTDSGKTATMSRFVLGEETDRTVSDALREAAAGVLPAKPEDTPLTDKGATLVQILTGPKGELLEMTKDDVVAQMGEAGYSPDQTRRAREELAKRCRIGKPFQRNSGRRGEPYYWKLLPLVEPDAPGPAGSLDGPKTTEGLPSCHSVSEQGISTAIRVPVGKDGKVGNSLGESAANRSDGPSEATVTDLGSRRSTCPDCNEHPARFDTGKCAPCTKATMTAGAWLICWIRANAGHNVWVNASDAYEEGTSIGYQRGAIKAARQTAANPRIEASSRGRGAMWRIGADTEETTA